MEGLGASSFNKRSSLRSHSQCLPGDCSGRPPSSFTFRNKSNTPPFPEPTSLLLVGSAVAAAALRRRRGRTVSAR